MFVVVLYDIAVRAIVEPDADDDTAALVARRGPPSFSKELGRLRVERWDLPAPSATFDLVARLADASVRVAGDPSRDEPACAPVSGTGTGTGTGTCETRQARYSGSV